jgi:uncharacterized protein with FMN-binding domain
MLFRIHDLVVMNIGLGVIATSFLFSLFTRWGFFDFSWVIVKWLGLMIVFLLITFFLAPAVNGMAALSDVQGVQALNNPDYCAYERQTTSVSLVLLVLLTVIIGVSVFKPWGPRKKPFTMSRKAVLASGISVGVLVIGGTVVQSMQLEGYRMTPVYGVDLALIEDGTYIGGVNFGIDYDVEVRVQNHAIESVNILSHHSDFYPRLAGGVIGRIVKAQSPNVAAITGATTSSKGLMKAVEQALILKQKKK